METPQDVAPRKRGTQLQNAERLVLIGKMVELMGDGYHSTNYLAKQLRVSRATIDAYRPLVDKIISDTKIDRGVVRNLQIKRTYQIIEQLMLDLKSSKDIKERALIYNSIYKFSSHLALITGLNVETHVNVDPTKLVIIRSGKPKRNSDTVNDLPAIELQAAEKSS